MAKNVGNLYFEGVHLIDTREDKDLSEYDLNKIKETISSELVKYNKSTRGILLKSGSQKILKVLEGHEMVRGHKFLAVFDYSAHHYKVIRSNDPTIFVGDVMVPDN